jgi:hypothetical protein
VLLHMKRNVSTKQATTPDFFVKNDFDTGVLK